ncbi:MAG TPA: hypothetical protein VME21_07455 [Steroidobacteraceae bacterium]|nr:hypothetical protein [Steroidobacteraceae bacterium]
MIRLTVIDELGSARPVNSAPYFRITGGAVWIGPSGGGEKPLVRYVSGRWRKGDLTCSGMRFEGRCRLVFGLAREPTGVSEELSGVSIAGDTLSANGIPFAIYDTDREMWRGVGLNTWWHSFRVESSEHRRSSSASDHADAVGRSNPGGDTPQGLTNLH